MHQPSTKLSPDALMTRDGASFAGLHVTVDLYGAVELDNIGLIEKVMRECVVECGATLLHIHLNHFTPNDGVTGVAVLAESHISVHTWPEKGFAAFDLFMCGDAQPEKAIGILEARFCAKRIDVNVLRRGLGL
ncbi:MAG: S-adenosylmethionine decarboxylase [Candidatus Azotimanducaceae bacterium]